MYIDKAIADGISERRTCTYLELNRKTIQNWRKPEGTTDKRKGSARYVAHRHTAEEEEVFYNVANSIRFRDSTPEQIVAILAEECNYYGSSSVSDTITPSKRLESAHRLISDDC